MDTVGVADCDWVKKVFNGGIIDPELNNTMIVVIPKVLNPESFAQFHPISLCFVIYKLVMKVISNPFKYIFPKIIAQEYIGFIAGGNITNKIVIAQEIIHSMKSHNKRK